jgi:sugar lactone lactonase YvrE
MKQKGLLVLAAVFLCSISAHAGTIIYANSAGQDGIQVFDVDVAAGTETLIDSFGIKVSNGRGVVVVGDTLYYTDANSGSVSSYTLSSHTDNGALFTIAGASGLATMAFDGTNFYLGDYSGSNNVYHYSPTGTLLGTVQLSECAVIHQDSTAGYCDGLEYANGHLVSNEGDGGYGGAST